MDAVRVARVVGPQVCGRLAVKEPGKREDGIGAWGGLQRRRFRCWHDYMTSGRHEAPASGMTPYDPVRLRRVRALACLTGDACSLCESSVFQHVERTAFPGSRPVLMLAGYYQI